MKLSDPRAEFRGVKDLWFWNYPCFIINGMLLWQVGTCKPHPWPGCISDITWVDTFLLISRVNTKGQQVCAVMFCTRKSFNQTIFFSSDALRMSGGREGRIYVSVLLIRTSTRRIKMSFILARGGSSIAWRNGIHDSMIHVRETLSTFCAWFDVKQLRPLVYKNTERHTLVFPFCPWWFKSLRISWVVAPRLASRYCPHFLSAHLDLWTGWCQHIHTITFSRSSSGIQTWNGRVLKFNQEKACIFGSKFNWTLQDWSKKACFEFSWKHNCLS